VRKIPKDVGNVANVGDREDKE